MKTGDKVWLLMAEQEEYAADVGGAINPRSFEWVNAEIARVYPDGDDEGAELLFSDGSRAWYDVRFIMSERDARSLRFPEFL